MDVLVVVHSPNKRENLLEQYNTMGPEYLNIGILTEIRHLPGPKYEYYQAFVWKSGIEYWRNL